MENISKLLKTENSELARLLQFSLYGVEAALKQALTKNPNDPAADLCEGALQELNTLLHPPTETIDNSNLADILQIAPDPILTNELKLRRLQNEFNSDKDLALYLGNTLQSQTDSDLWNEVQRKLLRVPEDLAVTWRQRALVIAAEAGAQSDISNCLLLPFNEHENIYPGLKGSIISKGLGFSNQAHLHPQIAQLNLQNYPEDIHILAKLVSTCIKLIDIDPDLHHALKSIFSFDVINLHSKQEHRCQYIDVLIETFWRVIKVEESADSLSALRYWIDLDEAIHSLVFVPPADRFSWWGKIQQETRRLLKKFVQRAITEGHNIRIRQLSGFYADVCAYSKDDLRLEIGGNPGEVLSCLRVYAKINEHEFPGRVLFRSSR